MRASGLLVLDLSAGAIGIDRSARAQAGVLQPRTAGQVPIDHASRVHVHGEPGALFVALCLSLVLVTAPFEHVAVNCLVRPQHMQLPTT